MTSVRLLPATVEYLVALQSDPTAFGLLIGSTVSAGWPEFPESIGFSIDRLRDNPEELVDPEDGPIWRWERAAIAC